jgi:hypothetical protein
MSESNLVPYVGDPDFHDGSIMSIEPEGEAVRVRLRGASGKIFPVESTGVREVRAKRPEGMLLYALCELASEMTTRRFVFANWDRESTATLQIDAEAMSIRSA